MRFRLFIYPDGNVDWLGVDTGKTKVVAHNKDRKIIALKIAGHTIWAGDGKLYGPAHFGIYEYKPIVEIHGHLEIEIDELFGVLHWDVRGKK